MKGLTTKVGIAGLVTLLSLGIFVSPSSPEGGSFLYWASHAVKTDSIRTCYDFANDAMRLQNFQKIRRSANEVTGSSGGTYAAVTCIATKPQVTAVVMVVGSNGNEASRVRDNLIKKISGIVRFD
jgi:hypothetical protein